MRNLSRNLKIISVVEWKLWSALVQWRRMFRYTWGGRTNLGMTLCSVKVFMYVARNTGVQSTEWTDFMNEVLLLLRVHYRIIFIQQVPNCRVLYELFWVYLTTCPIINHYAATRTLMYVHNWQHILQCVYFVIVYKWEESYVSGNTTKMSTKSLPMPHPLSHNTPHKISN